jgi:uncharacterized protein YjbI with pentapeptide repeats
VELTGARVGGQLSLIGSKVSGKLNMNGVQIGATLFMSDEAEFADVELTGAHVNHLSLIGSKVSGKLIMNSLRVDETLFMRDTAQFADVELTHARVGALDLVGSKVSGKLNMNGLQVGASLLMGKAEFADVELSGARVRGQISLRNSKVTGELSCYGLEIEQEVFMVNAKFDGLIDCGSAKLKGDLYLDGSQFQQDVNLSGVEIGGALDLRSAQWSDGVALILRNAKISVIPALADAWAPKLDLEGFTYRSVGAADQFEVWFGKIDRYAPQPYDQLASIVQGKGYGTLATSIRYSGRERERTEATGGKWAWLTTLKWVIGYGYYPQFAIFWVIGLVMAGAIVLRASGEGRRNGMPFGLAYSFDILLPIIRLRDRHYQIDLKTWARYYFYGHKIMGYVLASFLIAGLSGLTK